MINAGLMKQHGIVAAAAPTMVNIYEYWNYGNSGLPSIAVQWFGSAPTVPTYAAGFNRYELYQNGTLIATDATGTGSQTSISGSTGSAPGVSNTYFVRVYDALGRYAQSNTITIIAAPQSNPTATGSTTYYGGTEPTTQVWFQVTASNGLSYATVLGQCSALANKNVTGANANPVLDPLIFSGNPTTGSWQWTFNSTVMNHGYSWLVTIRIYDIYNNAKTIQITNTL